MKHLKVSSIQRGSVYDGKGVRTTVFLTGCSCNCPWCCNPETIFNKDYYIDLVKCKEYRSKSSNFCRNCELAGGAKSLKLCPWGLVTCTFKIYAVESLFDILSNDFDLFRESKGGVTFSGGEPLIQYSALKPLLEKLKDEKINIVFETTLNVPESAVLETNPFVDEFIVDLKFQAETYLYDTDYINKISRNLSLIKETPVIFRMVFVDNVLEVASDVVAALKKVNVKRLQILGCHDLAKSKYLNLGLEFKSFKASSDKLVSFGKLIEESGISNEILQV